MNSATFPFQTATVTLNADTPDALLAALGVFGLGTPATNKVVKGTPTPSPAATPASAPVAEQGNASASTAAPASAPPASGGSEANGAGSPHPYNYNDISARVVSMVKAPKIGREKALALLGEFGVDHANKLKLEQYVPFVEKADALLGAAA